MEFDPIHFDGFTISFLENFNLSLSTIIYDFHA